MPSSSRTPLPDLGRWVRRGRRWLETPGAVLVERRLLGRRRVVLAEADALRFVPGSRTLSLEVGSAGTTVTVELLRLTQFRELTRTPGELRALADGILGAPAQGRDAAVAALRAQADFLAGPDSPGPMVSPLAPYVGAERAGWADLGHYLP